MFRTVSGRLQWFYVPYHYPRDLRPQRPMRKFRDIPYNRTRLIINALKPDREPNFRPNYFSHNRRIRLNFSNSRYNKWY